MDSVKIIKKYGQPSGVPVITAYVDEDAPGEAGQERKLYQHVITVKDCSFTIINDDSKPWTLEKLKEFLILYGYIETTLLPTTPYIYTSGSRDIFIHQGLNVNQEGMIRVRERQFQFQIVSSSINIIEQHTITFVIVDEIYDKVIEL